MAKQTVLLGKYQHYKGDIYEVKYIAKHSESLEDYVVYYCTTSSSQIWIRPIKMFSEVLIIKGNTIPRFKYLG